MPVSTVRVIAARKPVPSTTQAQAASCLPRLEVIATEASRTA
jgi:hypothetical protein